MKKNILLKTNFIVCGIIIIGFIVTSIISYNSNIGIFRNDAERVSNLVSEGMYNQIAAVFAQPVSVSLTMANDNLLKTFLAQEGQHLKDEQFVREMQEYLDAYKEKYAYDSVFLVSAATNRYYHFNGINRVLTGDNPENEWYYRLLETNDEYSLNVDNDEATDNSITIFVNCKIKNADGSLLGIVGVGLKINSLQELLKTYEDQYEIKACLVDHNGLLQVASVKTAETGMSFFNNAAYLNNKSSILTTDKTKNTFWYSADNGDSYIVSQYEPNLKWHLVVENDTSITSRHLNIQLFRGILVVIIIIILVLLIITSVISKYNSQIIKMTVSQEMEYQQLLYEATEGLYENIYELDITRNRAGGESTGEYFKKLGLSADSPADKALKVIANKQIKEEYIQGYLDIFAPERVHEAYNSGINNLNYDLMISEDGKNYHWIRINARLFYWNSDQSIRMITYRKNIDQEKQRELMFLDSLQRDSMTGLYNKRATEEMITTIFENQIEQYRLHAFLIFDIDDFKSVNDNLGHNVGDYVIHELANEINAQFRDNDVVGRIGGDEFVVLMKNLDSVEFLKEKLIRLCTKLSNKDFGKGDSLYLSCSIGVAFFPQDGTMYSELYEKADQALYYAKGHGKNSFSIFGENSEGHDVHVSQRDMEILLNAATDGIAKFACTEQSTLLYFNQKYLELLGTTANVLSAADYRVVEQVHPNDVEDLLAALLPAMADKSSFKTKFRIKHGDGSYFLVCIHGIFISELYNNQYPVFYAMYTKQLPADDC